MQRGLYMKKTSRGKSPLFFLLATSALNISTASAQQAGSGDWKVWGGDPGVSHFSTLDQINTKNVSQLKPVWIYDSGKFGRSWEDTPLLINGLLYVIDAGSSFHQTLVAFALPRPGETLIDIVTSYPKRLPQSDDANMGQPQ